MYVDYWNIEGQFTINRILPNLFIFPIDTKLTVSSTENQAALQKAREMKRNFFVNSAINEGRGSEKIKVWDLPAHAASVFLLNHGGGVGVGAILLK